MIFKKYSSIENSYQQKFILKFMKMQPEAFKQRWIVRSKIDGANIQLVFQPNEPMLVGKRTSFLDKDASFFDIWTTLKKYETETNIIQASVNETGLPVRFYGEIYGPGINGRVNYGDEKKIALYDLEYFDDSAEYPEMTLMGQEGLLVFMLHYKIAHLLPPLIGIYATFEEALAVNPEYDSKILGIPNNPEEGLVIQPFEENIFNQHDRFILKKKGEKFLESENKEHKPKKEVSSDTLQKLQSFQGYINENRVLSVFSKQGPISDKKQMGDYIRWILDDAKEDYYKDNPELILTDDEKKIVYNVGKQIVDLLKAHL